MTEMLIIFNPFANRGDSKHTVDRALQALARSGLDYQVELTGYRGHAMELAREASASGVKAIVAAGGDGTVNEVANGILQASEGMEGEAVAALGVLPVGSGNDFSWGIGIRNGMDDAVFRLQRGQFQTIDVALAEFDAAPSRYFINMLGCGFDTRVNIEAHKIKRLRGFAIYMAAVLKTLAVYFEKPSITVRLDDETLTLNSLMALVANGPRLGGGFLAAPNAVHDDGLMDLCLVGDFSRLEVMPMIPKLMKGKHTDHSKVTMARSQRVVIESESMLACQADGETIGENLHRISISTIPRRLRVVA